MYCIKHCEGRVLRYTPNEKDLHCLDCLSYLGAGNKGFIFGDEVIQTKMGATPTQQKGVAFNIKGVEAIKTMEGNKKIFCKKDMKQAEALRPFKHVSGHPSDATLLNATKTNGIKNSHFAPQDVKLMNDILGKSIYGLKGKSVR